MSAVTALVLGIDYLPKGFKHSNELFGIEFGLGTDSQRAKQTPIAGLVHVLAQAFKTAKPENSAATAR